MRDHGIGIPEDRMEGIFAAFEQVDGTTSRHYGGTGLGLSIARNMARLLGGEIAVESSLGGGSCFTLTVPALIEVEPEIAPPPRSVASVTPNAGPYAAVETHRSASRCRPPATYVKSR